MPAPENALKARLLRGEVQLGCWLNLAAPIPAEIAARAGFDWCLIDGEHGPNGIGGMLAQVQAMASGSAAPVARLPVASVHLVKQVLDIGVQTVVIPMIEDAATARKMARAMRYPPVGNRGYGAMLARAAGYGDADDYFHSANNEVCLFLQVESRAGIDALEDILAVPGVDGVFIGPADLAADMGAAGAMDPAVQDAIRAALTAISGAGKLAGILSFDPAVVRDYIAQGARFVAVASDVALLREGLRARLADIAGPHGG